MRYIATILFSLFYILAFSQQPTVIQAEYFIDTDPGYGNATPIVIASNDSVNIDFDAVLSSSNKGIRYFGIRFKDDSSRWSQTTIHPFMMTGDKLYAPIQSLEYAFDIDDGFDGANKISFASSDAVDVKQDIDISGLEAGFHTLYMRMKDENANFSHTLSRPFMVVDASENANISQIEYFIDVDPGAGMASSQVPPVDTSNLTFGFDVDLTGLAPGTHHLFVRAYNDKGNISQTLHLPFFVIGDKEYPNLERIEYTFDNDSVFESAQSVLLSPDSSIEAEFLVDLSGISPGIHNLMVRGIDEHNAVTQTHHKTFFFAGIKSAAHITGIEYFFDTDPGAGQGNSIPIPADSLVETTVPVDLTGLSEGIHKLYLRAKDENNQYSLTQAKTLLVFKPASPPNLVELEYFINDDPGFGMGEKVMLPADSMATMNFAVDLTGYEPGFHMLHLRGKDANGNYSLNQRMPFLVVSAFDRPNITAAEYFLDTDPGLGNATSLPVVSDTMVSHDFTIDLSGVANGIHTVYVRTKDASGNWSQTYRRPFFMQGTDNNRKITRLEYFLNEDPGAGNAYKIAYSPDEIIDTSFTVQLDTVDYGEHKLFVRAFDEKSRVSLTHVKNFIYRELYHQNIPLYSGWNIMSFYVEPLDTNIRDIVQPLIDEGSLVKVQDEQGNALENILGEWVNTIQVHLTTEGYYINVSNNTELEVEGTSLAENVQVPIKAGWNVISYPSDTVKKVSDALNGYQNYYNFQKLQDETGASYEYVYPVGYIENIDSLKPGEGYKLRVRYNSTLYMDLTKKSASLVSVPDLAYEYFSPSWTGNGYNHMNIYITEAKINGVNLEEGDELAAFDGNVCVGIVKYDGVNVSNGNGIITLKVSQDDPYTEEKDGFKENNEIVLKAWDKDMNQTIDDLNVTYHPQYEQRYKSLGSAVVNLSGNHETTEIASLANEFYVGDNYPNPFNVITSIPVKLPRQGRLIIELFNITGEKAGTIINQDFPAGNHLIRINKSRFNLSAGIYLYRVSFDGNRVVNELIVQ